MPSHWFGSANEAVNLNLAAGVPRQGVHARLGRAVLCFADDTVIPSLVGFSHVIVLHMFHLVPGFDAVVAAAAAAVAPSRDGSAELPARSCPYAASVRPPGLRGKGVVGVLATRWPQRPNPIGVTVCTVEGVFPALRCVVVSGADWVDGTPVVAVHGYDKSYCHVDGQVPGWSTPSAATRPLTVTLAAHSAIQVWR
jgi:tRNA (Thr-GGU) A37 N-methylase